MFVVNSPAYVESLDYQAVDTIGSRIVALRTARGMSQPELARQIGIKQPSLHNIETGKTVTLRGATLAGLCRVLNVHPEAILGGGSAPTAGQREAMLHESEIIAIWRSLTPGDQDHLLAIARALSQRMTPRGSAMAPRAPPPPAPPPKRGDPYTTEAGSLGGDS